MLQPFPHQLDGALFLAGRDAALLADEPRVGKTGAAIMAADMEIARRILVVTTASGRPVWKRAFAQWSNFPRSVGIVSGKSGALPDVAIVSWSGIINPSIRAALLSVQWDRIILDESHYAKSIEAKRTAAALGEFLDDGLIKHEAKALIARAGGRAWYLTGTPAPNAPNDLYPMLRTSQPESLAADADRGWPDVRRYQDFLHRYCIVKMKKLSAWRRIPVVIGGRNAGELRERIGDFMLRRTQQDVGIREPIYEIMPLSVSAAALRQLEQDADKAAIMDAAGKNDTKALEMHLGPLRRLTGSIKAAAIVDAVKEEFECGLDKIVLAYWHKEVGQILADGLLEFGVLRIDGSTPPAMRGAAEQTFLNDPEVRVMLAQIVAAGEAVDFSSAATLWFAEASFVPKDMKQMSLRITNHNQARQCLVRVCVLEGSIDEASQEILLRKWSAIREVIK